MKSPSSGQVFARKFKSVTSPSSDRDEAPPAPLVMHRRQHENWRTKFFVIGFSLRLPARFDGIEDNVNSRPQPSRQHAVRNPKSPVLYSGQCAWGKRFAEDGVTLEVDEYEQNVTAVVRHMRESGYKLRQIVDSLRELGVVGRTGKPIGTTRVFEIIHGARKKPGRSTNGGSTSSAPLKD